MANENIMLLIPTKRTYCESSITVFGRLLSENGRNNTSERDYRVFTSESLIAFWSLNFGNIGTKRKIPDSYWMFQTINRTELCPWRHSLASAKFGDVSTCLSKSVGWIYDRPMMFFGGIEVIETTWGFFVENWNTFVEFNDEGILCSVSSNEGILISPHGCFILVQE
jgi:hypothetical protein